LYFYCVCGSIFDQKQPVTKKYKPKPDDMEKPLRNQKTFFASVFLLLAFSVSGWGQYTVNFEGAGETKTAYASGTVNLNGLDWNMTEALIGIEANDFKNGARSARLRGYGASSMTMLENKTGGIGYITFQYRRYGTDAQVDWKVEYSTNDGVDWIQAGSVFTAPATDEVQIFLAKPNILGDARIRIKRATETGTANRRLNIDDIVITDFDNNPPIAEFVPADGATAVFANIQPLITFNKDIFTTTGDPVDNTNVAGLITFKKTDAAGDDVAFSATIADGKVITVMPDADLDNEQIYYLAIAPVQDAAGNESTAQSITFTTIADTAPVITLTYPEGGETLYAFDFTTITWISENIDNVKVEVWIPSEANWLELAASVAAIEGEFTLQIPADAEYSTQYKIRVSDASTPEANDVSEAFTIIAYAATIADLRNNNAAGDIVKLAGEGVITFQQTFRNQRFIQDATAAVLIDDDNAKITTSFSRGDGIVNLVGKLVYFSNYIQFVPEFDPGPGNSPALYTVVPAEISMEQFLNNFSNYESQLVTINEMVRFPAANGTATFSNGGVLDITNDELTGKFRSTFFNVDYVGEIIPEKYIILTGIINERTSSPVGKYITPRDLADFQIFGNDATLSHFTIGGEDMLALDGLVVDEPEDKGAYFEVDDFSSFTGLVATLNDANAQKMVKVNGVTIDEGDLASLSFADGDVILIGVVAEDTKTTKFYKVTLWEEIPFINITEPEGGTVFFVLQTLSIKWETNLTGMFLVEVTFPNDMTEIVEEVNAEDGVLNLNIPNGIPSGTYKFRLIWKENTSVTSDLLTLTATDNLKPSLVMTRPANGAKNVLVDEVLRMTFDEEVFANTGNIVVKKAEDNSVFATIDIEGADVEFNGNEVEFPIPGMDTETEYYVLADQGIVMDVNGLEFDGITDENTWRFTTVGFYDITILVTDGTDPVEDATVILYTDPLQTLQTNAEGKAVFENIPYGTYMLNISKTGYEPSGRVIYADEDKIFPVILIPEGSITFEVRFELTHGGNPFPWAQLEMDGYGMQWSDENGIVLYSKVLPAVDIPFTVTNWDIETYEGLVTVTDANVVVPVAVTKVYEVVFIVTDGTAPLGGALVEFDGQEVTTSENGYAIFTKVREGLAKPYTVSKTGYVSFVGAADVGDHWNQISVALEKVKVMVTFNVSDESGAVEGALVNFNEEQKTTGSDGKAIFNEVEYELGIPYIISKDGYHTANGTVDATEDTDVNVTLDLIKYTVTFTVSHGANPVSGATVTVSGQSPITTNASGVATIDLVPGPYTYSVTATGFVSATDIGFTVIDDDLSIPVNLSAVNIIDPGSQQNRMLVYPNPSDGRFTLEIGKLNSQKVMVEILDITGKVVYRNDFNALGNLKETIDMQHLTKGMYFLRILEGDRISTMKLMFR
jgi:hypothetical protein